MPTELPTDPARAPASRARPPRDRRRPSGARRALATGVVALLALSTGGCLVGPDYEAPKIALPDTFSTEMPGTPGAPEVDLERWWEAFGDAEIDTLVTQALDANRDLAGARARVREARATRAYVAGGLWPEVDLDGNATRGRRSVNAFPGGGAPVGQTTNLFTAAFDATWELDLFGGTRRQVEAADADVQVATESLRDVRVSLAAEVVRNVVDARAARKRLQISRDNISMQAQTVQLIRSRRDAGLATELDVQRAEAQLSATRATVPEREIDLAAAEHALDVLLARPAGPGGIVTGELDLAGRAVPRLPEAIPVDLLRRRPDLREAERKLAAATARVGVATADLYPKLKLNGSYGYQAQQQTNLLDAKSDFWNAGLGVSLPVFDAGRLRAQVKVADARVEQALAGWEGAVYTAMAETADALVAFARQRERRGDLSAAVDAQSQAMDLARKLYDAGLVDFLDVLDAQRNLLLAQDSLAGSDRELGRSYVALCKALGGGWSPEEPVLPEDAPAAADVSPGAG